MPTNLNKKNRLHYNFENYIFLYLWIDRKTRVRNFIKINLSDIVRTIRERFAMKFAKISIFQRKNYRRSSLSYIFRSTGLTKNRNTRQSSGRAGGRKYPIYHRLSNWRLNISVPNLVVILSPLSQISNLNRHSPDSQATYSCSDGLCSVCKNSNFYKNITNEMSRKIREWGTKITWGPPTDFPKLHHPVLAVGTRIGLNCAWFYLAQLSHRCYKWP